MNALVVVCPMVAMTYPKLTWRTGGSEPFGGSEPTNVPCELINQALETVSRRITRISTGSK